MTDAVRDHVRKILQAHRAHVAALHLKIREIEAVGGRIIDGGQLNGDEWDITDWRTDEEIARGDQGEDGYDRAAARLDPDGKWWHIDAVHDQLGIWDVDPTDGVPPTLADLLRDWSLDAPPEDVAVIADLSVGDVEKAQDDGPSALP